MALHPKGYWIPELAPKGMEAFNCYSRFTLYSGPRYSTKSITATHRLMRHVWECPSPRVAVINKTVKGAKAAGIWLDLVSAAEQWVKAGIGMRWVTKPKTTSDTKMSYFEVINQHGKKAEVQLSSRTS